MIFFSFDSFEMLIMTLFDIFRGDAEMVLRSCTDVFDGTSLRPLSPDDIGRLLQVKIGRI